MPLNLGCDSLPEPHDGHCGSCHDDEEMGYDALMDYTVRDTRYWVCCAFYSYFERDPADESKYVLSTEVEELRG